MKKNEELKKILLINQRKYPLWDICDSVKLIYQNEFGGRHIVTDRTECIRQINAEIQNTPYFADSPQTEDIGGGTVRANLLPLFHVGFTPEVLADAFIRSTHDRQGTLSSFENKLSLLIDMSRCGLLSFSPDKLDVFLIDYKKRGYPPLSHSEKYKKKYFPAYRLISKKYISF